MSRWRIITVLVLIVLPVLFLIAVGSWFLWKTGWGFILWWPMAASVAVGYFLAYRWLKGKTLLQPIDMTPPDVATERDRLAWQLVERRAREGAALTGDQL